MHRAMIRTRAAATANPQRRAAVVLAGLLAASCAAAAGAGGDDVADAATETVGVAADVADAADVAAADGDADIDDRLLDCGGCAGHQRCARGVCVTKTCASAGDCNDPPGRDPFFCPDGTCRAWQCANDSHCGDGSKCNTLTYKCYQPAKGCTLDAHCVDDDGCTNDSCVVATGACSHSKIPGCCKTAADCGDDNGCTTDGCEAGKCTWKDKPGCCSKASECDDGDACTVDACKGGTCSHAGASGCCSSASQCDDGEAATTDSCVAGGCVHALVGAPKSCASATDCKVQACATGSCVGGACSFAKATGTGCCETAATCALGKACAAPTCQAWTCATTKVVGGVGPHTSWDFEGGLEGWSVSKGNSLAFFHSATGWAGHGAGSLRYGVPGKETWKGGTPNHGTATSPAFVVPAQGVVKALVFFDGEPGAGVHLFSLSALVNGQTVELWSKNNDLKGNTAGGWKPLVASLAPWAGKSAQLQWKFDVAVTFPKEDGHGLHLDAVVVEGACP